MDIKKQTRTKVLSFLLCFVLVLLYVGVDFMPNASIDAYSTFSNPSGMVTHNIFNNGRPVMAIFFWVWDVLNIDNLVAYFLLYGIGFAFFTLAIYKLQNFLYTAVELGGDALSKRLLAILASALLVLNPFVFDIFLYLECSGFALAAFLSVCAFLSVQNFFETKKRRYIFTAVVELIVSVLTFQTPAGLFVVLNLPFLVKKSHTIKEFVVKNLIVAGIYATAGVSAFIFTRYIVHSTRGSDESVSLVERFLNGYYNTVERLQLFLPYFFAGIILFLIVSLSVVSFLRDREGCWANALGILYIGLGTLLAAMPPYWFSFGIISYRASYPAASIVGALFLYFILYPLPARKASKWIYCSVLAIVGVFCLLTWARFQMKFIHRYWQNAQETFVAYTIGTRVEEYEKATGIEVKKISLYEDAHTDDGGLQTPLELHAEKVTANSFMQKMAGRLLSELRGMPSDLMALRYPQSRVTLFAHVMDRHWEEVENDPQYAEYFQAHDWKAYSEEQLIFDGDTIHLCIY